MISVLKMKVESALGSRKTEAEARIKKYVVDVERKDEITVPQPAKHDGKLGKAAASANSNGSVLCEEEVEKKPCAKAEAGKENRAVKGTDAAGVDGQDTAVTNAERRT